MKNILNKTKIAIIGIGYVGLPLLKSFSNKYSVIGYDINKKKIENLKKEHQNIKFSYLQQDLDGSNFL